MSICTNSPPTSLLVFVFGGTGVDTRAGGATTFVVLLMFAASPVNVISYMPRSFFGALLVLIAVDLMAEWLWQARHRCDKKALWIGFG